MQANGTRRSVFAPARAEGTLLEPFLPDPPAAVVRSSSSKGPRTTWPLHQLLGSINWRNALIPVAEVPAARPALATLKVKDFLTRINWSNAVQSEAPPENLQSITAVLSEFAWD